MWLTEAILSRDVGIGRFSNEFLYFLNRIGVEGVVILIQAIFSASSAPLRLIS